MNRRVQMWKRIFLGLLILPGLSLFNCNQGPENGLLIFTRVAAGNHGPDYYLDPSWRFDVRAEIVSMNPEHPEKSLKVLTKDFYSARGAEISMDGTRMIFSGKITAGDPWQIWEMNLKNHRTVQLSRGNEDGTDPTYLADGRILFTKKLVNDPLKSTQALFSMGAEGCCEKRVTFNPNEDYYPALMTDGRVMWLTRQGYPEKGYGKFLAMRPDGTKVDLFYKENADLLPVSKGRETPDGKFLFVNFTNNQLNLMAVQYSRPLQTKEVLTGNLTGSISSVYPVTSEKYIISFREAGQPAHGLYEFDARNQVLGRKIFQDPVYDFMEPVLLHKKPHYRVLPSEVDDSRTTGLVMCMDTDKSGIPVHSNPGTGKTATVQILGIDGLLAEVPVEVDGSFYIAPMADTPMRFQTVDRNGEILRGPSDWMWVRPNERIACIGCHENRELAPDNYVPVAITKLPVQLAEEKSTKPIEAH